MDWYRTIFDLIDMRSFSNLWYWITLAAIWTMAGHYVLGVPYDMVGRAVRHGGQASDDLHVLVRIRVLRILHVVQTGGPVLVAVSAACLSALALLGFRYGIEFAQAVFLIALPLTVVGALSVRAAGDIQTRKLEGDALFRRLWRHRLSIQAIAMVSIFVTAMWGMYRNLNVGPLGG